jgi:periplasmic protein TonB
MQMTGSTPRESNGWGLIIGLVFASGVAHALTIIAMPDHAPVVTKRTVEMEFYEPPPPPPPPKEEPPPPPKPIEPPKVKLPPPPVKVAEVKPPPKDEPPPPNDTPPPEAKAAPPIVGISLNSTTSAGSFAVGVGNTTYGKADKVVNPNEVKPYSAPRYAPPGGADTEPVPLTEIKDPYPDEARKAEVEGTVRLKVTLSPEGVVENVVVINGPGYGLNEAALSALKRFKFKPATKGGQPVGYTFIYNYTFLLD